VSDLLLGCSPSLPSFSDGGSGGAGASVVRDAETFFCGRRCPELTPVSVQPSQVRATALVTSYG
jgi:hypothetical protein